MVILIFPLLASSKRERLQQIGKNRVFAATTAVVMVKKQPVIHSSIWYNNDIGHPSHA